MAPIEELLGSARHQVDLVVYELADPVAQSILAADAARGVLVRVLLNRRYTQSINAPARSYLLAHHVQVRWAPSRFELVHEKAAVIDGATAIVMTLNLTARYYTDTRDVAIVDRAPADVAGIEARFAADWSGSADPPPTAGSELLWSPGAERPLLALIGSARAELWVENEELADPRVTAGLAAASRRGVKVVVVMTDQPEWHAAFAQLRVAGVEVRTFPDRSGVTYVHAKVLDVDPGGPDERAFVGSQNFSRASLLENRELGLLSTSPTIVVALAAMVRSDASAAGYGD
ncbi:MAG: cardiolipin synthase [Acidimicrobiaceae bacterium]|nr:cardiolipin synthase [Acidimicrobiaceae bacterium]